MSYSDFSIKDIRKKFNLEIIEQLGIFSNVPDSEITEHFVATLKDNIPLAIAINTEKAKSELLISPVLIEIKKLFQYNISFFSGVEFNVDKDKGLNGYCDFLVSLSSEQLFIESPVITLVEAKNESIMSGLGQCVAEMIAARIFNEQENNNISIIYGTVTTGIFWKFMKLHQNTVHIDLKDYSIEDNPKKIIGILSAMMKQEV
jgi:hypothetical protein